MLALESADLHGEPGFRCFRLAQSRFARFENRQLHCRCTGPDEINLACRPHREVNYAAIDERASIIDSHIDFPAVCLICDPDKRVKRQCAMSGGQIFVSIEDFSARRSSKVVGFRVIRRETFQILGRGGRTSRRTLCWSIRRLDLHFLLAARTEQSQSTDENHKRILPAHSTVTTYAR